MRSPLRLFCLLPIILFILIAFIQLILNGLFAFALWGFTAFLVINVCWPIIVNANEKHLPIYQIFSILIVFVFVAIVITFTDIKNYLPLDKAIIVSIFAGLGLTGLVLFLGGYNN